MMILYIAGRSLSTYAYSQAAWRDELPQVLWIVSDLSALIACLICYIFILYVCLKMYRDYELIVEQAERREDAKEDIRQRNVNIIIDAA